MTSLRKTLITLTCLSILAQGVLAEPAKEQSKSQQADGHAIPRSELLTQLESVLNRCESEYGMYATKSDVAEMRALMLQLRKEVDGLGSRVDTTSGEGKDIESRSKEVRRPSF